ncbi:MAG: helix-turn-helix transcriptional regulator [Lachnospiraceae bacterium]|nr:helix-turn-helix transcriptional regulator [Lachnospiraceae bacterium]
MEFHEKLQELRKGRGLTQEELAEALYVSRTAISKWESGRGYPSIDSLKEISSYFSVTIDELLSSDRLLSIAEKENKANLQNMCDILFGMIDVCSFMLIALPLYPNMVNGYIYSVNLWAYTQTTELNYLLFWIMYVSLVILGIIKLLFAKFRSEKYNQAMTGISMILGIALVLFLAVTREAYAVAVAFLLLVIKGILLLKNAKR